MSMQQPFFEALFDAGRPCPTGLSTWNGSDPAVRFAVYRNNVVASLINALADTYPVIQDLVGEAFFRAMAHVFVCAEPPCSPVLAGYGANFALFLEGFPPAATLPYLADVARLEWARVEVFHAADAEVLPPTTIAGLLADPSALPERRIGLHPATELLCSRYAIASLWAAHQGLLDIASVDPYQTESVLIIRPELEVRVIPVAEGTAVFIGQLLHGATLGSSVAQAQAAHADFDLVATLNLLIQQHAISTIR